MGATWRPERVKTVPTPSFFSMRATSWPPVSMVMSCFLTADGSGNDEPRAPFDVRGSRMRFALSRVRTLGLAEPGEVRGQLAQRREGLVGVDRRQLGVVLLLGLRAGRVGDAAVDRADRGAGLLVVEADALGAEVGVDDVDVIPLADRAVRALGLARTAVDALLGDDGRHGSRLSWSSPDRSGGRVIRRSPRPRQGARRRGFPRAGRARMRYGERRT